MSEVREITKDEYEKEFSMCSKTDMTSISDKHIEAIKVALDMRKFEIELYWKRAGYFWLFMAAVLTGYFTVESGKDGINWALSFLLAAIGLIIAITFYFANKGSKFWQLNWERHVDLLEDKYMGPLYKCLCVSKRMSKIDPSKEYCFSVSKLNQVLVGAFVMLWSVLFVRSGIQYFIKITECKPSRCFAVIGDSLWLGIVIFYVIIFLYILYSNCENTALKNSHNQHAENQDNMPYRLFLRK